MTSMEAHGPVSLDYYHGRRVEDVVDGDGAEGSPVWTIKLEGDALIHNFDPTIAKPKAIKGAALTLVILGAHTDQVSRTPKTELRFGLETVKLNPMEYAMADPTYTRGELVYAQRSNANMPSALPAMPEDRDAPGPEEHPDDA